MNLGANSPALRPSAFVMFAAMADRRPFDVDLTALLRVFGGHLYSTPDVFVRELVQNSLDAIAVRQHATGERGLGLTITCDQDRGEVVFADDGVGLDEDGLVTHLSRVGSSSKRSGATPGLIGQFGIGLLSGFLVADRLVVETRKVGGDALRWEASVDGSYVVLPSTRTTIGSRVTVILRPDMRSYARPEVLQRLLTAYVALVATPIVLLDGGTSLPINRRPCWTAASEPERLTAIARDHDESALAALPFAHGDTRGLLWIRKTSTGFAAPRCALYSRGILVSAAEPDILPRWARFIGGAVDAPTLAPTASREGFVRDPAWRDLTRQIRGALISWLAGLKDRSTLMRALMEQHHTSLMAACIDDPQLLAAFAEHLPFMTNEGPLTFGAIAARCAVIRYSRVPDEFGRLAPSASARGELIIDASHVHEVDVLTAWAAQNPARRVEALAVESLAELAEDAPEHAPRFAALLAAADQLLAGHDVAVRLKRFVPADLPVLLLADPAQLRERARTLATEGSPLQQALVRGLALTQTRVMTPLLLNADNPLISALPGLTTPEIGARVVRMLYLQAASLVRRVPSLIESRRFTDDLLALVRELSPPAPSRPGSAAN